MTMENKIETIPAIDLYDFKRFIKGYVKFTDKRTEHQLERMVDELSDEYMNGNSNVIFEREDFDEDPHFDVSSKFFLESGIYSIDPNGVNLVEEFLNHNDIKEDKVLIYNL